jgi:hypothetical protein
MRYDCSSTTRNPHEQQQQHFSLSHHWLECRPDHGLRRSHVQTRLPYASTPEDGRGKSEPSIPSNESASSRAGRANTEGTSSSRKRRVSSAARSETLTRISGAPVLSRAFSLMRKPLGLCICGCGVVRVGLAPCREWDRHRLRVRAIWFASYQGTFLSASLPRQSPALSARRIELESDDCHRPTDSNQAHVRRSPWLKQLAGHVLWKDKF